MAVAAVTPEIVTIMQARDYLQENGIESRGNSDLIQSAINAATACVYEYTARKHLVYEATDIVEYLDGDGSTKIMLHEWPVVQVTEVELFPHNSSATVTITGPGASLANDDMHWSEDGYVYLKTYSTPNAPNSVKVTYRAGVTVGTYQHAILQQAVLDIVLSYWQRFKLKAVDLESRTNESVTLNFRDVKLDAKTRAALDYFRRWHT